MNRYQDILGRINYGLFLTVVALLPFPQAALKYACVAWFITWALEFRWLQKPKPCTMYRVPFFLFGLWYAWKALSGLWAPDPEAWSWQIERYMTFAFMLPVALWGVNRYYNWRTAGKVLVISCIAAVPLYMLWMTCLFLHPEWVPYDMLRDEWIQHTEWFTFFSENISHFKHRLFLCSVELFGAVMACQIYRNRPAILLPSLVVMLSLIPLTGSRQSILTAATMAVIGILYALPAGRKMRYGIAVIAVGIIAGWGLLHFHPRMQEIKLSDFKEMRTLSYYHDIRLNIWGAALQHPEEYLSHGLGAGQSSNYLRERYQDAGFNYYAFRSFNAHNQYLEELMELGIPGLLWFVLAWLSIPLCAKKEGRRTSVLFTTLYMLNMFTDCMFGRFCGVALWAVAMLFILLQSDTEREEQAARNT